MSYHNTPSHAPIVTWTKSNALSRTPKGAQSLQSSLVASTDLLRHARLTKKTNTRGPNVEILARRSQERDRFLTNERRPSNAMDSDTELPPLLSSDSSVTQNASSMDFVTDLNTAHIFARDGPLSSISDTMSFSCPPEAISGATRSDLESTMGPYIQDVNETSQAFLDQDTFFTNFETFTENLCDEGLSLREPTVGYGGQPTTVSQPQSSEISIKRSNDCGCAPPLPWIANWCVHHLDQPVPSKIMDTEALSSLAPETVESLLRDYFQFVNPSFPVVSEWDVYRLNHPEELDERERVPPMSLALFNAVMFAASAVRWSMNQRAKSLLRKSSLPPQKLLKQLVSATFVQCVKHSITEPR